MGKLDCNAASFSCLACDVCWRRKMGTARTTEQRDVTESAKTILEMLLGIQAHGISAAKLRDIAKGRHQTEQGYGKALALSEQVNSHPLFGALKSQSLHEIEQLIRELLTQQAVCEKKVALRGRGRFRNSVMHLRIGPKAGSISGGRIRVFIDVPGGFLPPATLDNVQLPGAGLGAQSPEHSAVDASVGPGTSKKRAAKSTTPSSGKRRLMRPGTSEAGAERCGDDATQTEKTNSCGFLGGGVDLSSGDELVTVGGEGSEDEALLVTGSMPSVGAVQASYVPQPVLHASPGTSPARPLGSSIASALVPPVAAPLPVSSTIVAASPGRSFAAPPAMPVGAYPVAPLAPLMVTAAVPMQSAGQALTRPSRAALRNQVRIQSSGVREAS